MIAVAAIWVVDVFWARAAGIRLDGIGAVLGSILVLGANVLAYRGRRGGERAATLAASVAVFFAVSSGTVLMSYLAATARAPLADPGLARADAAFGFDWLAWYRFVQAHEGLRRVLRLAYASLPAQILICVLALPLSGREVRVREFIVCMIVVLVPTLALFALFPAASAWVRFGVHHPAELGFLQTLMAVREGRMTVLRLQDMDGLITFPSFHVEAAILLAYAARGTPLAFMALVLNGLMVLSAFSEGGHYLVDVLAGFAIAGTAIGLVRFADRRRDSFPFFSKKNQKIFLR